MRGSTEPAERRAWRRGVVAGRPRSRATAVLSGTRGPSAILVSVLALVASLCLGSLGSASAVAAVPRAVAVVDVAAPDFGPNGLQRPTFGWTATSGATSYDVRAWRAQQTFAAPTWKVEVFGITAAPEANLPIGEYTWRVDAKRQDEVIASSVEANFTVSTEAGPALAAPLDAESLAAPTPLVLKWQQVAGATLYTVQVDDADDFVGASSYTSGVASLVLPAITGGTWYWRVRATTSKDVTNVVGATDWSASRSFVWDPRPKAPTLESPANDLDGSKPIEEPDFTWSAVSGAAKYNIQISPDDQFNGFVVNQANVRGNHYVLRTTLPADDYFWRVQSVDAAGNLGPWSESSRFVRTWQDTPDAAVSGPLARPKVVVEDFDPQTPGNQVPINKIVVRWDGVPRADRYDIEIDPRSDFGTERNPLFRFASRTRHTVWTPTWDEANTLGASDSGSKVVVPPNAPWGSFEVVPGVSYFVRVRAVDTRTSTSEIVSQWSNERAPGEVTPPSVPKIDVTAVDTSDAIGAVSLAEPNDWPAATPAGPLLGAGDALTPVPVADNPLLQWRPVAGATEYQVYLARDAAFTNRVPTSGILYTNTRNTRLVLSKPLPDNNVGQGYFWYVVPCIRPQSPDPIQCAGGSAALNQPPEAGFVRAFSKRSQGLVIDKEGIRQVQGEDADHVALARPNVLLKWFEPFKKTGVPGSATDSTPAPLLNGLSAMTDVPPSVFAAATTAPVRHYEVSYRPVSSATWLGPLKTDATSMTLPDIALTANTKYEWKVVAKDSEGADIGVDTDYFYWAPPPVVNPTAAVAGSGQPLMSWTPSQVADSYRVRVFSAGNLVYTKSGVATAALQAGQTVDTKLAPGTYTWDVTPVSSNQPGVTAPGPIEGLVVGSESPQLNAPADTATIPRSQAEFSWNATPSATSYKWEWATNPNFASVQFSATTPDTLVRLNSARLPTVLGYWRVTAFSESGQQLVVSRVYSATIQSVPAAPTAPTATVSGLGAVRLALKAPTSTGNAPLTGFVIAYRQQNVGEFVQQEVQASGDTNSEITGLENNISYEFKVAAVNAVGPGPFSPVKVATMPTPPGAPTLSVASDVQQARLTWTKPSSSAFAPVLGYSLAYRPVGGVSDPWIDLPAADVNTTTSTVDSLSAGLKYEFRISARNAVGSGPWATSTMATPVMGVPEAPAGVVAAASTASPGTVTLSATARGAGTTVDDYLVLHRVVGGSWIQYPTAFPAPSAATAVRLTVSGLPAGVRQFALVARNRAGTKESSVVSATITTLAATVAKPKATSGADPARPTTGALTVVWAAPFDGGTPVTGYLVTVQRYDPATRSFKPLTTANTTALVRTWRIGGLAPGTTVLVQVAAKNKWGTGSASVPAAVLIVARPAAPTAVKAAPVAGLTKFTWRVGSNGALPLLAQYVQVSQGGGRWVTVATLSRVATSFSWRGGVKGKPYKVRVFARNAQGMGAFSSEASFYAR